MAADATALIFDHRYPGPSSSVTVNDWYREGSYDQMRISGEVVGYYTSDIDIYPSTPPNFRDLLKEEAIAKAAASGVCENGLCNSGPDAGMGCTADSDCSGVVVGLDENGHLTGSYHRVVFAIPSLPGPNYGRGDFAWISSIHPYLLIHELSHTFGLGHAGRWECGNQIFAPAPDGTTCLSTGIPAIYGDPFDPQGGGISHFNTRNKEVLGWLLPGTHVLTVSEPATYILTPLETSTGIKAWYIQRPGAEMAFQVDFRQPLGFDQLTADYWASQGLVNIFDGLWVYDARDQRLLGSPNPGNSAILDMTPTLSGQRSDFIYGALVPGATFIEGMEGVRISAEPLVGAGTDAELTVRVDFSNIEVDVGPDQTVEYPGPVNIQPTVTGGLPPYVCDWEPDDGVSTPTTCGAVAIETSEFPWGPTPIYTLTVYDSEPDSVPRSARVQITITAYEDCNDNNLPDNLDIQRGLSTDCNGNDIPDDCEYGDCNGNELPDSCDITSGFSLDENGDGYPDECAVLHVSASAPPNGDGLSWVTAFERLSDAIDRAVIGGGAVFEIWVAAGTYTPSESSDRNASFTLIDDVAIYGGFAGTELSRDERDWINNSTILSGDLNGDDVSDLVGFLACYSGDGIPFDEGCAFFDADFDGDVDLQDGHVDDNSKTVVSAFYMASSAALDGFVITAGWSWGGGSGIDCYNGSPRIANCVITANSAMTGGGVRIMGASSSPTLVDCVFAGNRAGSIGGGGIALDGGSARVEHCVFVGNHGYRGGGAAVSDSVTATVTATFANCVFSGNSASGASGSGGGLYNSTGTVTVTNCSFGSNVASARGGGLRLISDTATVISSVMWGNTGGFGNTADQQMSIWDASVTVDYSCVEDDDPNDGSNFPGTGNIDDDPLFVDPDGTDNVVGTEDDNLRLSVGSPCVDTGKEYVEPGETPPDWPDVDGNARIVNYRIDMGIHEFNIIFVDNTATGGDTGTTWANAYNELQDALPGAGKGTEIWVAAGTYKPDQGTAQTLGDRNATFQLLDEVTIYGGFPSGGGDGTFAARDSVANVTILSGNIGGRFFTTDNSYHVVTASGTDSSAVLDGFTVTKGYANGAETAPVSTWRMVVRQ